VQVGDGNVQINYAYYQTWTDGLAPPPLVGVTGAVDSPYRGLGAFEERDAAFFFGREQATTQVLERMSRLIPGPGLLVVSGASGAGKSSLLRAGVLPRLRGSGLAGAPGATTWPCLVFTPGRAPLDELAVRSALLAGTDAAAVRRGLGEDPAGFALTARQAALAQPPAPGPGQPGPGARGAADRRLLLVVDQFEQVFTQCADDAQREAFITALCAAAGCGQEPGGAPAALVVLGVRADFETRCAGYRELAGPVQDRYLLTPMTERQLRMAVSDPAKAAGSSVDDDLVTVLLAEVRSRQGGSAGAGVLPLLSHALDQAWRSRTGQVLTLADYERAGGIEGAVAASAERAYSRLAPGQQLVARQVFTRLTAASPDATDTADRATRAELTATGSPDQAADVEAVLEAFADERLLTLAADSVEISHEALLTAWPLLRDTWLAETHADRIARTRLRRAAAEWARSGDPSYLYRGTLLEAAAEAAGRIAADPARDQPLSAAERDFLQASGRARRRATRWRNAAVSALAVLTLAAAATAGVAFHIAGISARNAAAATRQHAVALSRQLAAQSLAADAADPVTARQLAVAAWSVSPTSQAGSAMTALLAEQQQDGMVPAARASDHVRGIAFSPDGRLLATADGDGTVRLWDPATGKPSGAPLTADAADGVGGVAFSPDGRLLATADGDGTVRLWDPASGKPVGAPLAVTHPNGSSVDEVAFSPDGKLLATANSDGMVRLWNPGTGKLIGSPINDYSHEAPQEIAFSPDGELLAVSGQNSTEETVQLWNVATERPVGAPFPGDAGGALAFSPDGKLLAITGSQGLQLWQVATGQPVGPAMTAGGAGLDDHGGVDGAAFSPDGRLVATAQSNGTVRLWAAATGKPGVLMAAGAAGRVDEVAFSPDGRLLASAQGNGTVRLWIAATGRPAGAPLSVGTGTSDYVNKVAFSRNGEFLATVNVNGPVRLWNPATGQQASAPITADTAPRGVSDLAFSPDGEFLATASALGPVRLWSPVTGQPVSSPVTALTGNGATSAHALAISPDSKLLATVQWDDGGGGPPGFTVRLWNLATGRPVGSRLHAVTGPNNGVNEVAFSPDGRLLATADSNDTVELWNLAAGKLVGDLKADPGSGVNGVAFSPDGKLLASADDDGTVRLWDSATGRVDGVLPADSDPDGNVRGLAFSPDGELLATVHDDGTLRLWNPATRKPVGFPVAADAGGRLTGVAFSADGKLLATSDDNAGDDTVRTWSAPALVHPYAALCAAVGAPTPGQWKQYAPGEPFPKVCA
jgi:WD40 repeat protein